MAVTKNEIAVNNAFIDSLAAQLDKKSELGMVFPAGYSYKNELLGAYLILKETYDKNRRPVLETCSQASIANALMEMVTNGLSMQKKQCYPVAYNGRLQCQISVYGNTAIARRYGMEDISATCIYKDDTFEYHLENGEPVIDKHEQSFANLDGEIVGAYAIATMKNGRKHVEIMTRKMIETAWRQGFGFQEGKDGTHRKFTDQMCMKTVKNRCLKYIVRTYGTQGEMDMVEQSEKIEQTDILAETVENDIESNANQEAFEYVEAEIIPPETEVHEEGVAVDVPGFMVMEDAE